MKPMIGLALLGSVLAFPAPARGGGAAEKPIHKDGVLRVLEDVQNHEGQAQPYRYLMKGDTHFGLQFLKPKGAGGNPAKDLSQMPTCYHHQRSPVGVVMATLKESAAAPPVAVVGMHVGTMAAHA